MNFYRRQLILLAILVLLACLALLLSLVPFPVAVTPSDHPEPPLSQLIRTGEAPRPRFSTSTRERVEGSKGAAVLLSYTEEGFEPREITIKSGETVRFTNNSDHDIWIAAAASDDERLYPNVSNGCGSSELDSCGAISPQDFWEFTLDVSGTWRAANTLNPSNTAVVRVQ